jgi:GT2 family glycosyltransferase
MSPATDPTPAEGTMPPNREAAEPRVGICVLDYLQPEATRNCIASLLAQEPASTRILWLENEAATSRRELEATLAQAPFPWAWVDPEVDPLPGPGVVGVVPIPENLGYAGGNNVGLRFFHRHGLPYAWVINNDTLLTEGNSRLLVAAAEARPEVGVWGAAITSDIYEPYYGGVIRDRDFRPRRCERLDELEHHPMAYVSGCSLFMRTALAASVGYIPDDYFLYFEDPAFSLDIKRRGLGISALDTVKLWHHESLSAGMRSHLKVFYNCRNRWHFIHRYFPEAMPRQRLRRWYRIQSLFFRGQFRQIRLEYLAYLDYRLGRTGRTTRDFFRSKHV